MTLGLIITGIVAIIVFIILYFFDKRHQQHLVNSNEEHSNTNIFIRDVERMLQSEIKNLKDEMKNLKEAIEKRLAEQKENIKEEKLNVIQWKREFQNAKNTKKEADIIHYSLFSQGKIK